MHIEVKGQIMKEFIMNFNSRSSDYFALVFFFGELVGWLVCLLVSAHECTNRTLAETMMHDCANFLDLHEISTRFDECLYFKTLLLLMRS